MGKTKNTAITTDKCDLFVLQTPIAVTSGTCSMSMDANVAITPGDMDFTPFCGHWNLIVNVRTNGRNAGFDLVENMLISFLEGQFAVDMSEQLSSWEQLSSGFQIQFSPGIIDSGEGGVVRKRRRYIQEVYVDMNIAHGPMSTDMLFKEIISIGDYALSEWFNYLQNMAPAVFTRRYSLIEEIRPHLRPLKIALDLDSTHALELAAEKLLSRPLASSEAVPESLEWKRGGAYFGVRNYVAREFVIMDFNDDEICTHTPVFISDIVNRRKRRSALVRKAPPTPGSSQARDFTNGILGLNSKSNRADDGEDAPLFLATPDFMDTPAQLLPSPYAPATPQASQQLYSQEWGSLISE